MSKYYVILSLLVPAFFAAQEKKVVDFTTKKAHKKNLKNAATRAKAITIASVVTVSSVFCYFIWHLKSIEVDRSLEARLNALQDKDEKSPSPKPVSVVDEVLSDSGDSVDSVSFSLENLDDDNLDDDVADMLKMQKDIDKLLGEKDIKIGTSSVSNNAVYKEDSDEERECSQDGLEQDYIGGNNVYF